MKRFRYTLVVTLLALAGCHGIESPVPGPEVPDGDKVAISFNVAVPGDPATRAMGMDPDIDTAGFYIAVFGGSGYFNEWVKATVQTVTHHNYDTTASTVYSLSAMLTVSDSRLRLHFIANCPTAVRTSPPISGSQDTEDNVLSKIRSNLRDTVFRNGDTLVVNDAYWQKVLLPDGIKVDKIDNVYHPTAATVAQFPDPIILVRNFARVYLRNLTPIVGTEGVNEHQLVTIKKYGLAFAPSEGSVAPILAAPYSSDEYGRPIAEPDDNDHTTQVFHESFFINYQHYPIAAGPQSDTLLTDQPFRYAGFSPANQAYHYYTGTGHESEEMWGIPLVSDLKDWDNEHPENNVLFVYERTRPSTDRRATRMIILAERRDQNSMAPGDEHSDGDRYYALDIVNSENVAIPLLRNQTYTVHLLNIEQNSGETDIVKASKATSATVNGDPSYQNLINVSDGKSSIGTSFTEKFYVKPQLDSVMFRYLPTNVTDANFTANQEGNDLVKIYMGVLDEDNIYVEMSADSAAYYNKLAFKTDASGNYRVWIDTTAAGKAIPYVREHNRWVAASQAQLDDPSIEKWGMVKYELSESYMQDGFFGSARTQVIHVEGSYDGRVLSRDVVIKTSPRQIMNVVCRQKYVLEKSGEEEVIRISIPKGLSRSVFPLEFTIEADNYSLTPNGDVLPVTYGTSTISGHDGPAYYFVRTVTQNEYDNELSSEDDWKYFDCHFKTTVSQNASTVYVQNQYFETTAAHDVFYNFQPRKFTSLTIPNTAYRGAEVEFKFTMDAAHSNLVWWDPQNNMEQSVSATNRVIPHEIKVILNGFVPATEADGTTIKSNLTHQGGNDYIYNVGPDPLTSDKATNVSLYLQATGLGGSTGNVTLSTSNLTDNPQLYIDSVSRNVTINQATFTGVSVGTLNLGLNQTATFNFSYVNGYVIPITIAFSNVAPDPGDTRFVPNLDGTYKFTPSNSNAAQSFTITSLTRYTPGTVTLSHSANYYTESVTNVSRALIIPVNVLYARNAVGTDAPTNFTAGSTYVYLNNTATYAYKGRSYFSNAYKNNSQMTVPLDDFAITDDDAVVHFIYQGATGYSGTCYYYETVMLSELIAATVDNPVTLQFDGRVRIAATNLNYSTSSRSASADGVTATFSQISAAGNSYLTLANGTKLTVSVPSGYHLSEVITTYNSRYATLTVDSGGGTISGNGSATTTWTAGNATTSSVVFNINRSGSNNPRMTYVYATIVKND